MPRKKKSKAEPTALSEVLETLPVTPLIQQATEDDAVESFKKQREREQAVTDPAQSDALAAHLEARRRKAEVEPERPMPEPQDFARDTDVVSNAQPVEKQTERLGEHTAAVMARRPRLSPPAPGFFPVSSDRQAGIRVSKSHDQRSVAIQFSEDRLPSRAEKDILERVGHPQDGQNFVYRAERRHWERTVPEGWTAGENTIDAHRVMTELAKARNEGLER